MTSVAVNFPYFFPYTGFYRLLRRADIFVSFDCVQFPRRGYVHRNQFPDSNGALRWFTLALARQQRDVLIRDIEFIDDIEQYIAVQCRRFPCLRDEAAQQNPLVHRLLHPGAPPAEFLRESLAATCQYLGIQCKIVSSSDLQIDSSLKGEHRVLAILEQLDAREYLNAPGGRGLYDERRFAEAGITPRFLLPYEGSPVSMLYRILSEPTQSILKDIDSQLQWQT
ncbi:MAG: WbqC family protein [Gammaproteobacteria bacterium]